MEGHINWLKTVKRQMVWKGGIRTSSISHSATSGLTHYCTKIAAEPYFCPGAYNTCLSLRRRLGG